MQISSVVSTYTYILYTWDRRKKFFIANPFFTPQKISCAAKSLNEIFDTHTHTFLHIVTQEKIKLIINGTFFISTSQLLLKRSKHIQEFVKSAVFFT